MKSIHISVSGVVQGVWFRAFVRKEAQKLNLTGWVRNRSDGTVEAVAEGETKSLELLLSSCRMGPAGAHVDTVRVTRGDASGNYNAFIIR